MTRNLNYPHLSVHNIKMVIFPPDFIHHPKDICNKTGFESNAIIYLLLKTFKFAAFFSSPFAPVFPWFAGP